MSPVGSASVRVVDAILPLCRQCDVGSRTVDKTPDSVRMGASGVATRYVRDPSVVIGGLCGHNASTDVPSDCPSQGPSPLSVHWGFSFGTQTALVA